MVRFGGRCGGDIPGKSGGSGGEEIIVSKGRFINDITNHKSWKLGILVRFSAS